jgi:large subunit ribosomal protein L15
MLLKVLGSGSLSAKLEVTADAYSASAKEAIEKAGGVANM